MLIEVHSVLICHNLISDPCSDQHLPLATNCPMKAQQGLDPLPPDLLQISVSILPQKTKPESPLSVVHRLLVEGKTFLLNSTRLPHEGQEELAQTHHVEPPRRMKTASCLFSALKLYFSSVT